jgi:hypothetical protein
VFEEMDDSGRRWAVKVFTDYEVFKRELSILKESQHEHIVAVDDYEIC